MLKVKIQDMDTGINYSSLKETKSTPAEASSPVKSGRHLKLILPDNEDSNSKYEESGTASLANEDEEQKAILTTANEESKAQANLFQASFNTSE